MNFELAKSNLKRLIKKQFRKFELELIRYNDGANDESSLAFTMKRLGMQKLIDVGANSGQFGSLMREYGYHGDILSFEPLPDVHDQLKETASKKQPWTIAPRCALGNQTGTIQLNVASNMASSSILELGDNHRKAAPYVEMIGQIETPIDTLDNLLNSLNFDPTNAFLKIDTQGYERQVLEGATETLKKIGGMQLELSLSELYIGQEDWLYFIDLARSSGFKLWNMSPELYNKETLQLVQINATFLKA